MVFAFLLQDSGGGFTCSLPPEVENRCVRGSSCQIEAERAEGKATP